MSILEFIGIVFRKKVIDFPLCTLYPLFVSFSVGLSDLTS